MTYPSMTLQLPEWVDRYVAQQDRQFASLEARMRFVIGLSQRNIEEQTGGPFGAAVFDSAGQLIAPGINLVTSSHCSMLHAETVALCMAQQVLRRYSINMHGALHYQLVTSTEPCAMCFGAALWAGINELICGASKSDAEAIGFDEGPKVESWREEMALRGIRVTENVLREEAAAVLKRYSALGLEIYNGNRR